MEQVAESAGAQPLIFLSRKSKLARWFQEAQAQSPASPAMLPTRQPVERPTPAPQARPLPASRPAAHACPKLQAVTNPALELTRPMVSALMRESADLRCRRRGVLLDNEYVRDVCASGCYQHCPFLYE